MLHFQTHTMEGNTSNNVTGHSNHPRLSLQDPVGSPGMVAAKIIVGSIGVVGNLLVVIVFMKHKKLFQHIKTTFIVNQSVIDCIVSLLLIMTTFISPELHSDVEGLSVELYCRLFPVYTCTFNPERNRFRSLASVYTTPTNPDQQFDPD